MLNPILKKDRVFYFITFVEIKYNKMKEEKKLKIGTLAWHEDCIRRIKEKHKQLGQKGGNKTAESKTDKAGIHKSEYAEGYGNTQKGDRKKPTTRYRSRVEYDFLKYIRVSYKWALDNHPSLTRSQIDLLLYLYAEGAFSKNQFDEYHRLIGIFAVKTLQKFQDEGYVKLWRASDKKVHRLYTLTQKGKVLCNKIHRICIGDEEVSMNPLVNKMLRKDKPRINTYYLDMIRRMNSDKPNPDSINEENPDE